MRGAPTHVLVAWVAAVALATGCSNPVSEQLQSGKDVDPAMPPYAAQEPPGATPVLFAPGVVNTDAIELNGVFSPDGAEFYFTRIVEGEFTIHRMVYGPDGWGEPQPLTLYPGGERSLAVDMALSPDGNELYFLGRYPNEHFEQTGLDLWVSAREGDSWSTARALPPPLNSEGTDAYPSLAADGSLYFFSNRDGGHGLNDLYRAQRRADGTFDAPRNLGPPISTAAYEADAFVAPDESYLILTSTRPGGFGQADLYVSFRNDDGTWGEPHNLGETVNTDQTEFCPAVTPDGKYLFFSRRWGASWDEATRGDVYWIDARVLRAVRDEPGS